MKLPSVIFGLIFLMTHGAHPEILTNSFGPRNEVHNEGLSIKSSWLISGVASPMGCASACLGKLNYHDCTGYTYTRSDRSCQCGKFKCQKWTNTPYREGIMTDVRCGSLNCEACNAIANPTPGATCEFIYHLASRGPPTNSYCSSHYSLPSGR